MQPTISNVADAERGFVIVFDHNGGLLRYIGNFRGEPQYACPTGMMAHGNAFISRIRRAT